MLRKSFFPTFLLFLFSLTMSAEPFQPDYDRYFTSERMRVDLVFSGDAYSQSVSLDAVYREPEWSGAPSGLIDPFGYGDYRMEVYDGDDLIYSTGFNTLFEEWRTTEEAQTVSRSAGQSIWLPFPKHKVEIRIKERVRTEGTYNPIFSYTVDPDDRHIISGKQNSYDIEKLLYNGPSKEKVDIVVAAEGYDANSMDKFRSDAGKLIDYFFTMEPYASRKDDFNVWLVCSPSADSGVDIPQDGIWKGTVIDSMFDTFYIDRYLAVMDHRKIASVVSGVPFDAIMIIANEVKYGGGGFYHSYAMGTSDNARSFPVYIHEFGHSFAGLGDEYYDSEVAYEDYYPSGVEPWEPNITTLVNFESKWKPMLDEHTLIPTPADNSHYGQIGVYEGAGYMAKGCYRPFIECRMFNNTAPSFCPVCQDAISRMIDYFTGR